MTALATGAGLKWLRHPTLSVGAIASLIFLLFGFVSVAWVPYPIESIDVGSAMQDMSAAHWLGTDHLGRDMLSMVMKGILTSFVVAAIAVAIGALVGIPIGLAAAAWGGPVDWAVLRVTDFVVAFPALIVAIILAAIYGPGAINLMIAVGIFNITVSARVSRDGALRLRGLHYVDAARLAGLAPFEIARRHILPGIASLVLVQAVVQLALGIIAEASLSYVGLGAQPAATSLGLMLREAQTYASLKPSVVLIPGLVVLLMVIALNLAADGLRDKLDPELRGIGGTRGAA